MFYTTTGVNLSSQSESSQDKEPEEVKKQTKAGEGQRSQRGVKYYQRSRSEEKSANIDETAGMNKGKVKPPVGAKGASGDQQHASVSGDTELDSDQQHASVSGNTELDSDQQQGGGTELDDGWQFVWEEELQVISTCKCNLCYGVLSVLV